MNTTKKKESAAETADADPDAGRPAASPPDGERGELVRGKEVKGRKGAKTAGIRAAERCYKMRV